MAEADRVLLVTRNLPPLLGGMERLNWHIVEQLLQSCEVRVVAPAGSELPRHPDVQLLGAPARPLWRFLAGALCLSLIQAWRWRPQTVVAGSGLTAPLAWMAARVCGARALVYLHGMDIGLRHPLYAALWLPFIRRMDVVIANSSATRALALARGVPPSRIRLLHPGVAMPAEDAPAAPASFRETYGLGPGPILLSVGRLTERKGLLEFVRDVLPLIAAQHPTLEMVIVGHTADDALAARSQSKDSILAEARRHGMQDRIRFVGAITDIDQLAAAYRMADVHLFPVREIQGDPEGFGMVAIEAAAHGLPTVAYATGGVVDAVAEGVSGNLVAPHDADAFAARVNALLHEALPKPPMRAFASRFAWPVFGDALRGILRGLSGPGR